MKRVRTYRVFESSGATGLTPEQREFLNANTVGSRLRWKENPDGTVDVIGDFILQESEDVENLMGITFNRVTRRFSLAGSSINSTAGFPRFVGGDLDLSYTPIESMVGGPDVIMGTLCFEGSNLETLEGMPDEIQKDLVLDRSYLTKNLSGGPKKVKGAFYATQCNLTSLDESPKFVGGDFICNDNEINSLIGSPDVVIGDFDCSHNAITSLQGSPQEVGGDFNCSGNNIDLTSLVELLTAKIGGKFICDEFETKGNWGIEEWIRIFDEESEIARNAVLPLLSPDFLNQRIEENPTDMIMKLKKVWKSPAFREVRNQLVIPDKHKEDVELVADLVDLGF